MACIPSYTMNFNSPSRGGHTLNDSKTSIYGDNPAKIKAASALDGAFFFVPANSRSQKYNLNLNTIMIKTNQFSAKTPYVTPWCRSIVMKTQSLVCQSPGQYGYGRSGEAGQDGEYDENDRWNF